MSETRMKIKNCTRDACDPGTNLITSIELYQEAIDLAKASNDPMLISSISNEYRDFLNKRDKEEIFEAINIQKRSPDNMKFIIDCLQKALNKDEVLGQRFYKTHGLKCRLGAGTLKKLEKCYRKCDPVGAEKYISALDSKYNSKYSLRKGEHKTDVEMQEIASSPAAPPTPGLKK